MAHQLGIGQAVEECAEARLFSLWKRGLWTGDVLELPWRVCGCLLEMDREFHAARRGRSG